MSDPLTPEQTRDLLTPLLRNRFGHIPADVLLDHVLAVTFDADLPVSKAAVDALVRRRDYARRDELRVASRPGGSRVLGEYTTRAARAATERDGGRSDKGGRAGKGKRSRRGARPYQTRLEGIEPLRGSCTCPDFLHGSLGLCKHLLVVLDHVFGKQAHVARAQREASRHEQAKAELRWDPVRPLRGEGDRLAGLHLQVREPLPSLRGIERHFIQGGPDPRQLADTASRYAWLDSLAAELRRKARHIDVEPAAGALVDEERARAEYRLACERDAPRVLRSLSGLGRKLYPYQREGVERFLRAGRLLLADDMGLGKTVQAAAACHALFRSGRVKRGVLIVPASLKSQWQREWQATTDVPIKIVEGRPEERARQYRATSEGFLVVNYELLLKDLPHVQKLAPDIVVLDEAQRIKNWATKSSLYVKTLSPRYRLVLTGTPMENRLEELASILDFVDDLALNPKWRLAPWHSRFDGDGERGQTGARNLDTLRARLGPCTVRRVRKEVLAQLPARTDTRVPVEMTPQQRAEHDDLAQPIASLMRRAEQRPLTQPEFLRLMQLFTQQRMISNGLGQLNFDRLWPTYAPVTRPSAALLDGLFAPKLHELRRLVEEIVVDQERKVVVFSQWRKMLRLAHWSVQDLLHRAGARAVFFTGAERPAQRTRAIVDFHDEPDVRVMFLTDAGGVGLNLQKAASACINLELPWNPAVLEQRIGRIYRLGQRRPIDVYNLVSEYGIESRIASLVEAKQALFAGLFDGTCDEVRFDKASGFMAQARAIVDASELELPSVVDSDSGEPDLRDVEPAASEDFIGIPKRGAAEAESARSEDLVVAPAAAPPRAPAAIDPLVESSAPPSGTPARDVAAQVTTLFGRVRVSRTADGGMVLEAPPEAAASLSAMLAGMARLFEQAATAGSDARSDTA